MQYEGDNDFLKTEGGNTFFKLGGTEIRLQSKPVHPLNPPQPPAPSSSRLRARARLKNVGGNPSGRCHVDPLQSAPLRCIIYFIAREVSPDQSSTQSQTQ